MKLSYIIILSISLFLSCCTNRLNDNPNIESIYVNNGQLYFKGDITESSLNHALTAINNYKGTIRTMTVNSLGGDIIPAMQLGRWVFDNKIKLTVNRFCVSSCANYLFTAAESVHINKNAVLIWHGGATQKSLLPKKHTSKDLEAFNHDIKIEKQFFEHIGVKEKITVYGQLNDFSVMENTPECVKASDKGVLQGWTYSIEDLKKFGVDSITSDNISPSVADHGHLMACLIKVDF